MLRLCIWAFAALLALATGPLAALADGPLVSVAWLKANLGKSGLVLVDVRSGAGVTRQAYAAAHIPGAIYTDYGKDGWREKNAAGVEGMLPPPAKIEALLGKLGISNASHVVLIPEGRTAADVGTATRLYWTLKVMGHDRVSILDGGFQAWIAPLDPNTKQPVNPLAQGGVTPPPAVFKATVRSEMLIDAADVAKAQASGMSLIDNRPHDFFVGLNKSPAAKRAGTIKGAVSVPEGWYTVNGGGTFRPKAQLTRLYEAQRVSAMSPHITFCNTGHWASLGWFVASELLGNRQVVMYDGSMADWTQDAGRDVEVRIKVE